MSILPHAIICISEERKKKSIFPPYIPPRAGLDAVSLELTEKYHMYVLTPYTPVLKNILAPYRGLDAATLELTKKYHSIFSYPAHLSKRMFSYPTQGLTPRRSS